MSAAASRNAPRLPFERAARVALQDEATRETVRRATDTIRARRAAVVEETPDWAALRAAGEAIRERSVLRLDALLLRLEDAVAAAGGEVHWARDAAEANEVVVGLITRCGVREVVKVKSLTTDELGLNDALAKAGVEAIETDLAERIIQLADERPSHPLVPSLHRGRPEIAELLRVALGEPRLADDPESLLAAARQHLREAFLRARVAVSGANFAVAETGTVAVVESEGNGRMCTTLPETLITVMGVEKVVEEWRDLGVLMQLLPRSATGERMNPYTSFWTGVSPGDGPSSFHLVLVDAGRTRVLGDPDGRQALRCIRCSACVNVCPVYRQTGGHAYDTVYPGPIGAILQPQLSGEQGTSASLPFASTLCGACADECPVGIDIPRNLVHERAKRPPVEAGARASHDLRALVHEDPRDVDPDRAHVRAGAAERRGVGQRRRGALLAGQLRLQDRPDRRPASG